MKPNVVSADKAVRAAQSREAAMATIYCIYTLYNVLRCTVYAVLFMYIYIYSISICMYFLRSVFLSFFASFFYCS